MVNAASKILPNVGIGMGSALGTMVAGVPEAVARGMGGALTGLANIGPQGGYGEKVFRGLGESLTGRAEQVKKFKEDVFVKPFEQNLNTGAGMTGNIVGQVAPYILNAPVKAAGFIPQALALGKYALIDTALSQAQTGGNVGVGGATAVSSLAAGMLGMPGQAMKPGISGMLSRGVANTAPGYIYDVAAGVAGERGEDRTGMNAFIPGAGSAFAGGLGGLVGVKNFIRPPEVMTIQKRMGVFDNLKKSHSKVNDSFTAANKKMGPNDPSVEQVLAETDLLNGATDKNGTVNIEKAQENFDKAVEPYEGVVREELVANGDKVRVSDLERARDEYLKNTPLEGAAYTALERRLNAEIEGFKSRVENPVFDANGNLLDGDVALYRVHDAKVLSGKKNNYLDPDGQDVGKSVTRYLKETVEGHASDIVNPMTGQKSTVKIHNEGLSKMYGIRDAIDSLGGRKVEGGRLGKHFATLVGAIAGGKAGGPLGALFGGEIARAAVGVKQARAMGGKQTKKIQPYPGMVQSNQLGKRSTAQTITTKATTKSIAPSVTPSPEGIYPVRLGARPPRQPITDTSRMLPPARPPATPLGGQTALGQRVDASGKPILNIGKSSVKAVPAAPGRPAQNPQTGKMGKTFTSEAYKPSAKVVVPQHAKKSPEANKLAKKIDENVAAQEREFAKKNPDRQKISRLKAAYNYLVKKFNELVQSIKDTPGKQGGFIKNPLAKSASPEDLQKGAPLGEGVYNVGITNVAGRDSWKTQTVKDTKLGKAVLERGGKTNAPGKYRRETVFTPATRSDELLQEAKTLYDKGDFAAAQKKFDESVKYGSDAIQKKFANTGIKVETKPTIGLYEGQIESSLDVSATVPEGKEELFHYLLSDLADREFKQKAIVTYREIPAKTSIDDIKFGTFDRKRGLSYEPMMRFHLTRALDLKDTQWLGSALKKINPYWGGTAKNGGKSFDIVNFTHYNNDYGQFAKDLQEVQRLLKRKGMLERASAGAVEGRHLGVDYGAGPVSFRDYKRTFRRDNPEFGGKIGDPSLTSKFLERVPFKKSFSRAELEQILKQPDIPATEREIVSASLANLPERNIPWRDAQWAVRKDLMRLKADPNTSYASYGLDNLGIDYDGAQSVPLRLPFGLSASGHGGVGEGFGWYRNFEIPTSAQKHDFNSGKISEYPKQEALEVSEIQSDAFQRGTEPKMVKPIIKEVEDKIAREKNIVANLERQLSMKPEDFAREQKGWTEDELLQMKEELRVEKLRLASHEEVLPILQQIKSDAQTKSVEKYLTMTDWLFKKRKDQPSIGTMLDHPEKGVVDKASADEYAQDILRHKKEVERLKKTILSETTPPGAARQFTAFGKDNRYRRRLLEEVYLDAKKKGYKYVDIPEPSTVAKIEWNYGNSDDMMPYEWHGERDATITYGDEVGVLGEKYTVVNVEGRYQDGDITVAPADKVHSFSVDDFVSDEVDNVVSETQYSLKRAGFAGEKDLTREDVQKLLDDESFDYWEAQNAAKKWLEDSTDDARITPSELADLAGEFKQENIDVRDELESIYGRNHVFFEDWGRGSERVHVVEDDAHTETFSQPSEYENSMSGDALNAIDGDKSKLDELGFSSTEKGVLENYYEYKKIIGKMSKEYDIKTEPIEIDATGDGPVKMTRMWLNRDIKRSSF